ncbi:DUF1840 domain-containing protein [Alishewanella sp. 16-MA]|uniref:DUF1840 domain-containing protein n=1 Tax=Alishewanella maricola TaxID=2795740 RepID=A0ABS8C3A9_9ALTE|nr:DUF1840 domain-containing protein [Alishewanella maricola]
MANGKTCNKLAEITKDEVTPVPLATRAKPLLKLLAAVKQANTYVMWQA